MNPAERRDWVIARAHALGFDLCGVAPADEFEELARLPEWLARGYAGQMRYLEDPRRRSPQAALPGARSVIVCALNYNTALPYSTEARTLASVAPPFRAASHGPGGRGLSPDEKQPARNAHLAAAGRCGPPRKLSRGGREAEASSISFTSAPSVSSAVESAPRGWISRYAWGDDYHDVLGKKIDALLAAMRAQFSAPFDARAYVDTGPVHERVAAHHAGLGWLGKNTCLINEDLGSWLFLGVIVTSLELAPSLVADGVSSNHPIAKSPDHPIPGQSPLSPDLCGQCTQCIDACPTGAIVAPYVLDARRCISYLTIEHRGPIPGEFHAALGWHVFGCDICQDVCPFNRKAPVTTAPEFQPRAFSASSAPAPSEVEGSSAVKSSSLFVPLLDPLASLSESDFRSLFKNSAIKRTKHAGLSRNAALALKNSS